MSSFREVAYLKCSFYQVPFCLKFSASFSLASPGTPSQNSDLEGNQTASTVMAEAVVSFVIERLGDLLLNEAKLLSGVRDEVEEAKTELQRIKRFLEDADARARQGDKTIRQHVSEIREAAYDLEDVIATFALKAASRSDEGRKYILKRFACILIDLHTVGKEVEKICAKISKSRSSFQEYGVLLQSSNNEIASFSKERLQGDLRRTFSHNIDSDFVGFGENIKELVSHLTREGSLHRVVSICGMGGLGKTTLARQIYYHGDVRHHFDCFAWASVSQKCQARDVWEGILIKLVSPSAEKRKEIKEMGDDEMSKALYDALKGKKCLVVLDDIWTTATWDCLKSAFPNVRSDSKLLLTTRNRDISLHADRHSILHEPRCFNESESWELFEKKIYFGRDVADSEDERKKKTLAQKMLDYCDGLPLAITVLAGLLSSKQSIDEWETLHKNIKAYMRKGKINEQEDSNLGVSWVLGLSYDELPYHMKPCFLHLAYFPEDFEIRAKELCRVWMAEGFTSTEDAAYECLSELVQRCILQVAEWGSTGRIKTCRIHDLMRDLCLSKAQEENFLETVDLHQYAATSSSSSGITRSSIPTNKVRRLAIYLNNNRVDELLSVIGSKDVCLRSLVCFNPEPDTSYRQVMKPLLNRFHLLRVLKFENLSQGHVGDLPKEIGDLIHLRLLSLKDSYVEKLPSSIGNLRCLQTLDLRVKAFYVQKRLQHSFIPSVLWKLQELRHLYLPQNYLTMGRPSKSFFAIGFSESILRLDNLTNLQTMVNVSANNHYLDGLEKLTNLTKLKVNLGSSFKGTRILFKNLRSLAIYYSDLLEHRFHDDDDQSQSQIGRMTEFSRQDVELLIQSCPQIYKLHLQVRIRLLPQENQFSPNLIKLTLVNTRLKQDPMVTLEKLPNLRICVLDYDAFIGNEMVCTTRGFPKLESLSICYLHYLKEWKVEEGALPSLRRLHIVNCLRLRTVPDGMRYLITLKEIVLQHMLRQFKQRVEQGGEDFYKVQHVPSLVFMNTLEF